MTSPSERSGHRALGFSLVELLAVIAIIGILAAALVPAFTSVVSAQRLTTATQMVADQMNFARQTAITSNRPVEVRFYNIQDPTDAFRNGYSAIRAVLIEETGAPKFITKVVNLPPAVRILPVDPGPSGGSDFSLSTLLKLPKDKQQTEQLPTSVSGSQKMTTMYKSFQFRPDGTTNLRPVTDLWFVTLVLENQPPAEGSNNGLRDNYSTIQVNASDGRVRTFRPGV